MTRLRAHALRRGRLRLRAHTLRGRLRLRAHALRPGRPHVVIAGVSTRAAAESAARAGFAVTALDGYADRDQHAGVRALALPRDFGVEFTAPNAAAAAASIQADAVVYLSNFENDLDAVDALAGNRTLWGNPREVLRLVRNPVAVAATFRRHGIAVPNVSNNSNDSNDSNFSNESNDSNFSNDSNE